MHTTDRSYTTLVELLSALTGYDPSEIDSESDFAEDLGLTAPDIIRVLNSVNQSFGTAIDPEEAVDEIETVGQLFAVISDETELG
jgi:acyl carrier protein